MLQMNQVVMWILIGVGWSEEMRSNVPISKLSLDFHHSSALT